MGVSPMQFITARSGMGETPMLRRDSVRKRSITGIFVVFAMFALGGAVMWGLFLAPRVQSEPAPSNTIWKVPDRPIRFVSYNILHNQRGREQVVTEINKLRPDIVCLQEIDSK